MSWKLAAFVGLALFAGIAAARFVQDPHTGTATWDAARAAGFAAYLLLWASTVLGIAVHMRFRPGGASLTHVLELHRISGTLALSFLVAHVFALVIDPVVPSSLLSGFVPFTSAYRPIQVGLGTLSEWLLVVVLASTALAGSIRYTTWRAVHLLAFPCYLLALVHGITSGTDTGSTQSLLLYAASAATVAAMGVVRIVGRGWVDAAELQP